MRGGECKCGGVETLNFLNMPSSKKIAHNDICQQSTNHPNNNTAQARGFAGLLSKSIPPSAPLLVPPRACQHCMQNMLAAVAACIIFFFLLLFFLFFPSSLVFYFFLIQNRLFSKSAFNVGHRTCRSSHPSCPSALLLCAARVGVCEHKPSNPSVQVLPVKPSILSTS